MNKNMHLRSLRIRKFSYKSCRENKTIFFQKVCHLLDIVEKYFGAQKTIVVNIQHA